MAQAFQLVRWWPAYLLLAAGTAAAVACGDDSSASSGGEGGAGAAAGTTSSGSSTSSGLDFEAVCAMWGARVEIVAEHLGCGGTTAAEMDMACQWVTTQADGCFDAVTAIHACEMLVPESEWSCNFETGTAFPAQTTCPDQRAAYSECLSSSGVGP